MTERVHRHVDYQSLVPAPKRPHIVLSDAPKRLIVVGDVHGCLEELQQLLVESNYNKDAGDEVLLVGDLVNKGPFSAETVQFARESNFHCIRGNHDDFALCHALQLVEKSTHPGLQYIEKLSQEDINWMVDLPYSISIPSWRTIFVHAGIVPTEGLTAQTAANLVTMRNVVDEDVDGATTVRGTSKIDEGVAWVSRWDGRLVDAKEIVGSDDAEFARDWHVIFGHDARRGLQQTPYATGLDTGCSYGKQLSAVILPEKQLVQVQAKAEYSPVGDKD